MFTSVVRRCTGRCPFRIAGRLLPAALLLMLTACEQALLQGTVYDVQGEGLPGVAIKAEGVDANAVTNARGEYRLRVPLGPHTLQLAKTGYTPGTLRVEVNEMGIVEATQVELWRLPPSPGVYIYKDGRYTQTTALEPKRYFLAGGEVGYATRREPAAAVRDPSPLIMTYKTPRYDARLSRLEPTEARLTPGEAQTFEVFHGAGTLSARLTPIDDRGVLQYLELDGDLTPGEYAVHWGALDGYATLDPRVFLFTIAGGEGEPAESEDAESAEEAPDDEGGEGAMESTEEAAP